MQTKGEKMNFLKNLFQGLVFNADGNELRQSFAQPDLHKAKPKPQRAAQANSKSVGLTPEQLDEALHWLSLY
jgi:hypothetical protein